MKPIISAQELLELSNNQLLLFDASNNPNAKENYLKKHLKGTYFIDINTELADIKEDLSNGGRHPLPTLEQFSKVLSKFGVTPDTHIIIYDHANGANAAARFWWMLKSVDHKKVQVLDGGIQDAIKTGFPINSGEEKLSKKTNYVYKNWKLPIASINDVERLSQQKNGYIIDVREAQRYNGETEPFDPIAGHIPDAHTIPFSENLTDNGLFLSQETLQKKYAPIFEKYKPEEIVVHCGSGVTACHTLLAMNYAGFEIPSLYVGSWSEWCRNNKEMITKK
ncbi:MAG: sulfurtransferase [Flavobacteriaceae bacterium]|jgi:thiosulfate/3-mercaptopyruvate sulfurtransferase